MKYEALLAKDGQYTATLNGKLLYSKYRPIEDAAQYIVTNLNIESEKYILFGLGLGYHLRHLYEVVCGKPITVVLFNESEIQFFERYGLFDIKDLINVTFINFEQCSLSSIEDNYQILIPFTFLIALDTNDPARLFFEAYKLNEMSFNSQKDRFYSNFEANIVWESPSIQQFKNKMANRVGCLVSAGPSIDNVLEILKANRDKICIISVGASLRILLNNGIKPDAVVISDPKWAITWQFHGLQYDGPLFYLSTACQEVVREHKGDKYIMYQEGFDLAQQRAAKEKSPLLVTGGSVATATFSLMEYLDFSEIILCGQDLGFKKGKTHSTQTTSGVHLTENYTYRKVEANSGELINISKSLFMFYQWFNKQVPQSPMKVYNTAFEGAKITGAQYIDNDKLKQMLAQLPSSDFKHLFKGE